MFPVVAVTLRLPPTAPSVPALIKRSPFELADVAKSIAALSTKVMLPKASDPSSACIVTCEAKALPELSSSIFDPEASVANTAAPVIVRVPLSVISPVVAVAVSTPRTVVVAKFNPASFTIVAAPFPFVSNATVPSTAMVPTLITPLFASVVAEKLPPTVTVPLSVIPDA